MWQQDLERTSVEYVMHTQSEKNRGLLAPSDCRERLTDGLDVKSRTASLATLL